MGLFSGLMGHASEADVERVERELAALLVPGEQIAKAFALIRDLVVFTNKRLVLVDKQGLTGKKVQYVSIPYSAVTEFSMENAGHFDIDAELRVHVRGRATPLAWDFQQGKGIADAYRVLAEHVLK